MQDAGVHNHAHEMGLIGESMQGQSLTPVLAFVSGLCQFDGVIERELTYKLFLEILWCMQLGFVWWDLRFCNALWPIAWLCLSPHHQCWGWPTGWKFRRYSKLREENACWLGNAVYEFKTKVQVSYVPNISFVCDKLTNILIHECKHMKWMVPILGVIERIMIYKIG